MFFQRKKNNKKNLLLQNKFSWMYKVLNFHTKVHCKTCVAWKGDTFAEEDLLSPSILPVLLAAGKIEISDPEAVKKAEEA